MNKMKFGFTSGSCAAAGAKAAAYMLLTGKLKEKIKITTPKGIDFNAELCDIMRSEKAVSCAVIKDGGADPDITSGCKIVARVQFLEGAAGEGVPAGKETFQSGRAPLTAGFCSEGAASTSSDTPGPCAKVVISGGEGVGTVTMPGLDQSVGKAAINSVPRRMIEKEVLEVCSLCDFFGTLLVEISVPGGKEIAEKTFNPRLGIKGGISILGTSGIVEPMSSKALLDTIFLELKQQKALGAEIAVVSPGNYGLDFMKQTFNFDLDRAVKCSNFIGASLEMAVELGFKKYLLVGHIGKLIKLSGGIMDTHSKNADCRMELLCAAAVRAGCSFLVLSKILSAVSSEEGCIIIKKEGKEFLNRAMENVMEKIIFYLKKFSEKLSGKIQIECMTFSTQLGLLSESANARNLLLEASKMPGFKPFLENKNEEEALKA